MYFIELYENFDSPTFPFLTSFHDFIVPKVVRSSASPLCKFKKDIISRGKFLSYFDFVEALSQMKFFSLFPIHWKFSLPCCFSCHFPRNDAEGWVSSNKFVDRKNALRVSKTYHIKAPSILILIAESFKAFQKVQERRNFFDPKAYTLV